METKEIDGTIYGVQKLPATKGLQLQLKLAKFIGGGISELKKINMKDTDSILNAMGKIVENVDDEKFAEFLKSTVLTAKKMVQVEGQDEATPLAIKFDTEFEDDYLKMYKLFIFVLEVNLGKFMQGIKSSFAKPTPKSKAKK